ncbi:hypothetical protein C5167_027124 [Papaver somniferum]|nr:hypothetical protein C5167_027124 [Papaver somniferum]
MEKVHVVCIPYPLQSHISAMMKLAKILHFQGFHITFVNTEFNHQRILNSRGPESLKGLPDFSFETISDGLPPTDPNAGQDILALVSATQQNCLEPFRNLINKLKNSNTYSNVPPVSYIISDACMSFTLQAGKELGIPVISYWAISFCFFGSFLHYPEFAKRGLVPLKDESITDEYLDTPVEWIPGMKDIRIRDLPSSFLITDPNNAMIEFSLQVIERAYEATAMLFNTFDALEMEVLTAFKSQLSLPPIYTIGPLPLLLNQISKNELQSLGSNMWKEDIKCLKWLDTKEPNSVMYVNFGSTTIITIHQLVEFAWGLANSKHNFLWIVRPDLVAGESAMLPPQFVEETKERGLLISWCPQEDVLNHPSVAGFLTHSGWNSTLESLSSGVPLICWPFHGDQQTNSRYSCKNWGVGIEIDSAVQRNEVEKSVRLVIEREKGKKMKSKALEWKKKAEEATSLGGSSYININKIVNNKPHVVCIPYPAQGHVSPMIKLAKILHLRGFHVTFVNTEFNHQRLLNSRGPDSLRGLPDFHFETIPDGLPPPTDLNATQDIVSLSISTQNTCLELFRNLVSKLNNTSLLNVPPVTCIVSDACMSFTLQVAKELEIPELLFWTFSFCSFACFMHYPHLIERGLMKVTSQMGIPTPKLTGYLELRISCLEIFLLLFEKHAGTYDATALVFNTFDELDLELLDAFKSHLSLPPIYTIGPIHNLHNQIPNHQLQSIESNLWKEETKCLEWLESKKPDSVVYVNFGSIAVMSAQQLVEFAWGLANTKHTFLWIIRPDLVVGESAMLPPEFIEETKERGLLASWCPQEYVLNHPSIAGFLTHCGWNSSFESLSSGVPMICWPFFADQQTNCSYSCNHWGVGMEIDNEVKRDEVEKLVRELMEGEKGNDMKSKAMEMMKKPHVVCIPYPAQGHISPMMKLAKILHLRGSHVTFVNTEFNHQRILNSRGADSLIGLPDFHFETIPDGLPPPTNPNATQDIVSLSISTQKTCLEPFRNLVHRLNNTSVSNVPPVTCIVSDAGMSFTLQVAKKLEIPDLLFHTISFCSFACFMHYPHLIERGLVPFKDLPSFVRTTDPNDAILNYVLREVKRSDEATAWIFNTFDELEIEQLSLPLTYTIGPLHNLDNQIPQHELHSIGSNLWKEDTKCIKWLDSKEPNSVVYVNFGSIAVTTTQQLVEFAWD